MCASVRRVEAGPGRSRWRRALHQATPPIVADLARRVRDRGSEPEWAHVGPSWPEGLADEGPGWNETSVRDAYARKWPAFVAALDDPGPLRASPEAPASRQVDLAHHNTTMVFAYCLALAARERPSLSMLDWGGGMGHYALLARALVPGIELRYTCRDLPILVDEGARLLPDDEFTADDACLDRSYDFVLASSSLQYSRDWRGVLDRLAGAAAGSVLVTRLPVVEVAPSFVFQQRPPDYGTQYPGWCINRAELLTAARACGLGLVREFDLGFAPDIAGAPEQNSFGAFLFRPAAA
jgi:putative methyltransferase (TIGR04325 family)